MKLPPRMSPRSQLRVISFDAYCLGKYAGMARASLAAARLSEDSFERQTHRTNARSWAKMSRNYYANIVSEQARAAERERNAA